MLSNSKNNCEKQKSLIANIGSDDSGINCAPELDQEPLNQVGQCHESLNSEEVGPEEEYIEVLETELMDEEYKILKSDICFYQIPEKEELSIKLHQNYGKQNENFGKNEQSSIFNENNKQRKFKKTIKKDNNFLVKSENFDINCTNHNTSNLTTISDNNNAIVPCKTLQKEELESRSEHIRSEILLKNLFDATKNAIFKTAQSIIESHDKINFSKHKSDNSIDSKLVYNLKKKELCALDLLSVKNDEKQIQRSFFEKSLTTKVPGVVKCFVTDKQQNNMTKNEKGHSGLLRFFESPVFNIHFSIHYLFYSKEPGVLSFIGNKIFSFCDQDVDLYIPQLIVMYIQIDELSNVLDPYLTHRCRKSVDFSLKCLWLLESFNFSSDFLSNTFQNKNSHLHLLKELYPKKEYKRLARDNEIEKFCTFKKTHHRSQSDASGLINISNKFPKVVTDKSKILNGPSIKLFLGDLTSGKAFDNGCTCFMSVQGAVNDLLGYKTVCCCNAPKMAPEKEFLRALINIGRNLSSFQTKAEKTSALRLFLNLINKNLPARVWLPLYSNVPHHIVRITEEKTAVLNSKDKTPYIIYVEVVEVDDIYTSPVITKLMSTLRHTKSEEHLDVKNSVLMEADVNLDKIVEENNSKYSFTFNNTDLTKINVTKDDVWSQEDDEITAQYLNFCKSSERDAISQLSLDSCDSRDQGPPSLFNIGDVRKRHCENLQGENTKPFSNDPEDPSAAALKEPWNNKVKQIRKLSPYGHLSNWKLLSAIVKCGDDLRQELMATQLLQMFKIIWQEEDISLWVWPYKIVCLSNDSGLIEPILNTVSLHQIKKNSNKSLRDYFINEYEGAESIRFQKAQMNFMQSCAAYCLISYLLQVKDRHNGNILLHSDGHLIHIDFGFILSISPKNLGFEQSPFKLTPEFVDVMGGTSSELWLEFNHLLLKGLMAARKHMDRIINLVEIMSNTQLPCFKSGCSGTVRNLRKRFHMNLTEQELEKKVEQLVQDSLKSLSTKLYDGYQYYTNGIL